MIICMSNTQPMQIHEVFASRIKDPTRAQEWSTQDIFNILKVQKKKKKCYKSIEITTNTEYKLKYKAEYQSFKQKQ